MHELAFYNLLKYKLANPHILLVSANVINHSMLAQVHARTGVFLSIPLPVLQSFNLTPTTADPYSPFYYDYDSRTARQVPIITSSSISYYFYLITNSIHYFFIHHYLYSVPVLFNIASIYYYWLLLYYSLLLIFILFLLFITTVIK